MHALIENNVITALRDAPSGGAWEDGAWLDFTDPAILAEWEKRHGWVPVTETPRPEDTETVKHDEKVELVDGLPVQQWKARPWNTAEVAERDARAARVAARAAVKAIVADLQAEKARAQSVIGHASATPREKDLGRACKRIADAAIDLARFVGGMS